MHRVEVDARCCRGDFFFNNFGLSFLRLCDSALSQQIKYPDRNEPFSIRDEALKLPISAAIKPSENHNTRGSIQRRLKKYFSSHGNFVNFCSLASNKRNEKRGESREVDVSGRFFYI